MEERQRQPVLIEAYDHEIEPPRPPTPPKRKAEDASSRSAPGRGHETAQGDAATSRSEPGKRGAQGGGEPRVGGGKRRRCRSPSKSPGDSTGRDGAIPVLTVKRPKTFVDHSYHDYSRITPDTADKVDGYCSEGGAPSFSEKLHDMLSNENYAAFIRWMPHGRAFKVLIPKRLETDVFPNYFKHGRYSTFLRQLNNYGFKHITQGKDRNCYYHEAFLRGLPHLLRYMPAPKNKRRVNPDPENEPDFYRISELYPLPQTGQTNAGKPRHPGANAEDSRTADAAAAAAGGDTKPPPAEDLADAVLSRAEMEAEVSMARAAAASQAAAATRARTASATSQAAAASQVAAAASQATAATRARAAATSQLSASRAVAADRALAAVAASARMAALRAASTVPRLDASRAAASSRAATSQVAASQAAAATATRIRATAASQAAASRAAAAARIGATAASQAAASQAAAATRVRATALPQAAAYQAAAAARIGATAASQVAASQAAAAVSRVMASQAAAASRVGSVPQGSSADSALAALRHEQRQRQRIEITRQLILNQSGAAAASALSRSASATGGLFSKSPSLNPVRRAAPGLFGSSMNNGDVAASLTANAGMAGRILGLAERSPAGLGSSSTAMNPLRAALERASQQRQGNFQLPFGLGGGSMNTGRWP